MQKYTLSLIIVLSLLLAGCHPRPLYLGNVDSLAGLQAMANSKAAKTRNRASMGRIRQMALRETALSLGAQAGLAWRANTIDKALYKQARTLDAVYDFNSLILDHNILPPVLLEGRNTLNLADMQTIRVSDRVYKISKQARFVTTPPNWRQYIWMDYKKPEYPNVTLLPKTRKERDVWCVYVAKGWKKGIEQANVILEESLARIKEDFIGMLLYRKLLAMNMVTPPFVSHTDLGVTGDETEIHIDDRVLRITALPGLNVNADQWRAAVAKDESVLDKFRKMENMVQNSRLEISSKAWQPNIAPINQSTNP